jgi:hypothetical protein
MLFYVTSLVATQARNGAGVIGSVLVRILLLCEVGRAEVQPTRKQTGSVRAGAYWIGGAV